MPIQHSLPANRQDLRPELKLLSLQLQELLLRVPQKGPGEDGEEEEENSVEEEESDGTKGVPAPLGASKGTGGPTLAQSDEPSSHQSEPCLLAIMRQMTQSMANL
ncbi:hypothetical protein O181_064679 [Austropuccinia psidii MF-1]|uniref:Uncharacterized protein n=1 Tax=Austropuccinia psidii MF-1 TaxID=1389203 RepID=A0A9Q3I3T0_9BASI|nr:hypothetical protein [Austropuccinia psidii MF-1]